VFNLSKSTLVKQIGEEFFFHSHFVTGSTLILRFRPKSDATELGTELESNHFLAMEIGSQGQLNDISLFVVDKIHLYAYFATTNSSFVIFNCPV
jgi:hypothetical protein